MRYLSLFSGLEACTVAWQPLGWECMAVAEIEPFPCAVLAHHYPDVPNLGDVTQITEEQIKALGEFDLMVFGSPCQNLSVAGNRKGFDGASSSLFFEAIRIFEYARKHNNCRFALWENVPGAFSSNKGRDFETVVNTLSGNGCLDTPKYGWANTGWAVGDNGLLEWCVLDAQYFGLAQRRKRVFALLDVGDWKNRPPILFESKVVLGDAPPSREAGQNPADSAKDRSVSTTGAVTVFDPTQITSPINASNPQPNDPSHTLNANAHVPLAVYPINTMVCQGRPSDDGRMGDGIGTETDPCPTLSTQHHHAVAYSIVGDATPKFAKDICCTLRSEGGGGIVPPTVVYGFDSRWYNQAPKELCPTLTATDYKEAKAIISVNSQQVTPAYVVRRLMPIECERLQGFEDNYTQVPYRNKPAEACANSPRYKAIGNSMAVPVMRWISESIRRSMVE